MPVGRRVKRSFGLWSRPFSWAQREPEGAVICLAGPHSLGVISRPPAWAAVSRVIAPRKARIIRSRPPFVAAKLQATAQVYLADQVDRLGPDVGGRLATEPAQVAASWRTLISAAAGARGTARSKYERRRPPLARHHRQSWRQPGAVIVAPTMDASERGRRRCNSSAGRSGEWERTLAWS